MAAVVHPFVAKNGKQQSNQEIKTHYIATQLGAPRSGNRDDPYMRVHGTAIFSGALQNTIQSYFSKYGFKFDQHCTCGAVAPLGSGFVSIYIYIHNLPGVWNYVSFMYFGYKVNTEGPKLRLKLLRTGS